MTRFNITLDEGISLLIGLLIIFQVEKFLYRKLLYKLMDLIKAATGKSNFKIIGLLKVKNYMRDDTPGDSFTTYDIGNNYLILPDNSKNRINSLKNNLIN